MTIIAVATAFLLGFGLTLWATPQVKKLATYCGALDQPDARKVHKTPMPLWGGLGVSLSATIAFLVALFAVSSVELTSRQFSGVIATSFAVSLL